jgi:hypothetical protein
LGDILFPARTPPSADEIGRRLDALVPTLPENGHAIHMAAAVMLDPSDAFRKSNTLSDLEKSLTGTRMTFPSLSAVNEEQGIVVWRHDAGEWTDKPRCWQMEDPNRSEYWRYSVAEEFARGFRNSPWGSNGTP